jgi:protein O-GlcNAcase / histone acetyltransferase
MAMSVATNFLAGVIEGFYGQPWSLAERHELFRWMAEWGLNTYLYAPKDDLKHRAIWREPYTETEGELLRATIGACRQQHLRFIYALGPGLDIRYGNDQDRLCLRRRFEQMWDWGCHNFALLFDDIPDRMDPEDLKRWGSLAAAQCEVTNTLFRWARARSDEVRFLFCPTPYCGRMAQRNLGGENYLAIVGRELSPEIDVLWTGPEIISREITVSSVQDLAAVLRRKPLIWDNLHANDYDGRRFYCGPYAGRPLELRQQVAGLLSNPNCEFPLNYVPLLTLAAFVHHSGDWSAREAYLAAMKAWLPHFETARQPVTLEDLILLGDCYYLPHEEGPEAEALFAAVRRLLNGRAWDWDQAAAAFVERSARLRAICVQMTELRQRPLFYALSRRIWELREELDLLEGYVKFNAECREPKRDYRSDFHLPGTYRGGIVPRLQQLLRQHSDGVFTPASGMASSRAKEANQKPRTDEL